jgi:hypothetical protein
MNPYITYTSFGMSESPTRGIEDLYGIDLLLNTHDKKRKKDASLSSKEEDEQAKLNAALDEFRANLKQRLDVFHPSNRLSDSTDHYLFGIWLYSQYENTKSSTPK